jgi:hypothetical protein
MFSQIHRAGLVDEVANEWASLHRLDVAEQFFETVEMHWGDRTQLYQRCAVALLQAGKFAVDPEAAVGKLGWLLHEASLSQKFWVALSQFAEEVPALSEPSANAGVENKVRSLGNELIAELAEFEDESSEAPVIKVAEELPQIITSLVGRIGQEKPHVTVQMLINELYPQERRSEVRIPILVKNKKDAAPAEEVRIQLGVEESDTFPAIEVEPTELTVGHLAPGEQKEVSFWVDLPEGLLDHTECQFRIIVHRQDDVEKTTRRVKIRALPAGGRERGRNNPFSTGEAVSGTEFVGREDIMRRLKDALASPTHERPRLVYGIRRIGKTSILKQLISDLHRNGQHYCVYFSAEDRSESDTTTNFLMALSRKMRDTLPNALRDRLAFRRDDFREDPYAAFEAFVGSLDDVRGQRRILLVLDEFDQLLHLAGLAEQRKGESSRPLRPDEVFQARTFGALRKAIMERDYFNVAFAGMPSIKETKYEDRLFGMMISIEVGRFTEEEAIKIIERGKDVFTVNRWARQEILAATGLQPYLLQLVCHSLYPKMAESGRDVVTQRDVEDVLRYELLPYEKQFTDYLTLIGDDMELLTGLALALDQVSERKRFVSVREVHRALSERGYDWTLEEVDSELARLRDEGSKDERPLIEAAGRGINLNRYRFVIGMLGEFLLRRGL